MSIQFIFGASGAGKTEYLLRKFITEAKKDLRKQYYLIVPEQDTLAMQKKIITHSLNGGHGILNIDVLSFNRLAYRVFEELNVSDLRIIDDMGKVMILRNVAEDVKSKLEIYPRQLDKPGFLSELKSQISEFYQYKVLPEMLELASDGAESQYTKAKLHDIALIYKVFRDYMDKHGYMTQEELLDRLYQKLPESTMLEGAVVAFDGFTGFTPLQLDILEELIAQTSETLFTLDVRESDMPRVYEKHGAEALYYLSSETLRAITGLAEKTGIEKLPDIDLNVYDAITGEPRDSAQPLPRFTKSKQLDQISRGIYNQNWSKTCAADSGAKTSNDSTTEIGNSNGSSTGTKTSSNALEIWEAPDQSVEIEAIAREIERAVREDHLRYQDFGIILTDTEAYRDIVYRVFAEAGVPYFLDSSRSLLDSPYAEHMRAALEAVDRNFNFDSVLRYLRALPRTPEDDNAVDLFENYLRERGISGHGKYEAEWEDYELLKQKLITPLLTMYEATKTRGTTVGARVEALRELIKADQSAEKVEAEAEYLRSCGDQNTAAELSASINACNDVLDRLSDLLGETKVARAEFRDILDAGFAQDSVSIIPTTIDQVVIGDLTRSRFSNPRRFFIAGVTQATIPKAESDSKLINDRDRKLFVNAGIELAPDRMESALTQRFYIYKALLNPSEKLIISYAIRGRNGKGQKPSGLIEQLIELCPGTEIISLRNQKAESYTMKELIRNIAGDLSEISNTRKASEDGTANVDSTATTVTTASSDSTVTTATTATSDSTATADTTAKSATTATTATTSTTDALAILYRDPEFRDRAINMLDAAFTRYTSTPLDSKIAELVYGKILTGSITRLEQFTGCAYAHFLKYGLKLSVRKTYEIQAFDIGNLYHAAIERCFAHAQAEKKDLGSYQKEELETLAENCVQEVADNYSHRMMQESARNQYLVRKVRQITKTTLWALSEQLRRGDFEVAALEKDFEIVRDGLRLKGRIDRVDLCRDGDHVYVKVIDYKTGATTFDLSKVYNGLQLQLMTYMNVALSGYALENPCAEVTPAAMLYYHIDDPVLEYQKGTTDEEYTAKRLVKLKMDGLVNTDLEVVKKIDRDIQKDSDVIPVTVKNGIVDESKKSVASSKRFNDLGKYVAERIEQYGKDIKAGEISAAPVVYDSQRSACTYCDFHSVCKFDPRITGFSYRRNEKLKPEEIWGRITENAESKDTSGNSNASCDSKNGESSENGNNKSNSSGTSESGEDGREDK